MEKRKPKSGQDYDEYREFLEKKVEAGLRKLREDAERLSQIGDIIYYEESGIFKDENNEIPKKEKTKPGQKQAKGQKSHNPNTD